jgi:hypothetical protein
MEPIAMPEKRMPTCRVVVSKEEAAKMKVGSNVKLEVSGEVKSLHPDFDNKEMYEVEVENPSVQVEMAEEGDDKKDDKYDMATMPRKDLKKKIMPKEDKE